MDVNAINIPVVGGHAGASILPLLSQATPSVKDKLDAAKVSEWERHVGGRAKSADVLTLGRVGRRADYAHPEWWDRGCPGQGWGRFGHSLDGQGRRSVRDLAHPSHERRDGHC